MSSLPLSYVNQLGGGGYWNGFQITKSFLATDMLKVSWQLQLQRDFDNSPSFPIDNMILFFLYIYHIEYMYITKSYMNGKEVIYLVTQRLVQNVNKFLQWLEYYQPVGHINHRHNVWNQQECDDNIKINWILLKSVWCDSGIMHTSFHHNEARQPTYTNTDGNWTS